jgi:hypothetical protein
MPDKIKMYSKLHTLILEFDRYGSVASMSAQGLAIRATLKYVIDRLVATFPNVMSTFEIEDRWNDDWF